MKYRFMAPFVAACGYIGFDAVPFCAGQQAQTQRQADEELRRQRLNPLIRMTSPAFGRTPEDSMLRWAPIVLP